MNAKYRIVYGKDLRVGDVIILKQARQVITNINHGSGASSTEFGTYISITTNREPNFWIYEKLPIIVENSNIYDSP